jgi:diaminopimelate epimerase
VRVWRAHGLGNDYLVWEGGSVLSPNEVVALCDRHRGVGGDGVLEPLPGPGAAVRIWNPDGSVAEKSGNGLRIFARWWHERRAGPPRFAITTTAGTVHAEVAAAGVTVDMGVATVAAEREVAGVRGTPVSVGNPHFVVFPDGALDELPWRAWGAAIERDPVFPGRTNVQFARLAAPGALEARIWERGAGETLASGSSACAVVAAAVASGRVAAGEFEVHMPGGTLEVRITGDLRLVQRGPVEVVGEVDLDPRWWAAHGATPTPG